MKKLILISLISIALHVSAQKVEVVDLAELERKMIHTENRLTLFNFWATWCGPCIKELPHFDALASKNKNVKVYLVSVDFPSELEKVKKFVAKKSWDADVLFLNEKDADRYMTVIHTEWSGAIPATLFVTNDGKTFFHEKAFTEEELEKHVKNYLN